jgi:hypothetical protein
VEKGSGIKFIRERNEELGEQENGTRNVARILSPETRPLAA